MPRSGTTELGEHLIVAGVDLRELFPQLWMELSHCCVPNPLHSPSKEPPRSTTSSGPACEGLCGSV